MKQQVLKRRRFATRADKLSISLNPDMVRWLRRAALRSNESLSMHIERRLQPAFEARKTA